jgi:hypothetical protein
MKTDTIEIPIPKGHTASFDEQSGKITFKKLPENVMEQFKTIDDVLADHGLTGRKFDAQCEGLEEDEVAYRFLKLLAKSLNQGWVPNWNDNNEYKYGAWFYMSGSSGFRSLDYDFWNSDSDVGSRLCFKSSELAKYAGTQFTESFKQFMLIK